MVLALAILFVVFVALALLFLLLFFIRAFIRFLLLLDSCHIVGIASIVLDYLILAIIAAIHLVVFIELLQVANLLLKDGLLTLILHQLLDVWLSRLRSLLSGIALGCDYVLSSLFLHAGIDLGVMSFSRCTFTVE